MFNLLMKSIPWESGRDILPLDRLFEYTNETIAGDFKEGSRVLFDKLVRFPCLFMQEGRGDELAYTGKIASARIVGAEISIEYTLDSDVPPFLNSTIYNRRTEFDMPRDFEFSRNHWAVKDVDLYRVLLRNFQPRRQRPTVFTISEQEKIEPALVSVMMPFDAGFGAVYDTLRATVERTGLRCRRADEIWENPAIIQDIVSLIDKSRVVVCDCTGRNPNVFYEIGIAHTLGREVILITQTDADIPFDLRHLRYVRYLNNAEGREQLSVQLAARINTLLGND